MRVGVSTLANSAHGPRKGVAHVGVDPVLRHVSWPAALPVAAMIDENQTASGEASRVSGQSPHLKVAPAAGPQDERRSVALDLVVDLDSGAGDGSHGAEGIGPTRSPSPQR